MFVDLSAVLTGFDAIDLEGTGLVDAHCALLHDVVGAGFFYRLIATARHAMNRRTSEARDTAIRGELLGSATFGPVATNLIVLWYLGQWNVLPDDWFAVNEIVPTAANATRIPPGAYEEALAYRVFGAHPPGAKPPGHGSWSAPPLVVDNADPASVDAASRRR